MLCSCIKDNQDDCPPTHNVRLLVTTDYEKEALGTRAAAEKNWYQEQIENVTVYIFDENDHFVTHRAGGAYTLGKPYEMLFNLPTEHHYRFVAWTNQGSSYTPSHSGTRLTDSLTFDELSVQLSMPSERTLTEDIPHRHQGVLSSANISRSDGNIDSLEIVLSPHTYRVNVEVEGLVTSHDQYRVTITDRNDRHGLDTHLISGEEYRHVRLIDFVPDEGETFAVDKLSSSMILLQIGDDTGTAFQVENLTEGTILYTADLLETIQKAYTGQIGPGLRYSSLADLLNRVYQYTITLYFTSLGDVEVKVNNWKYSENDVPL
jgi:hypothetical protein